MVWCKMFITAFCVIFLSGQSFYDTEVMRKAELSKTLKVLYNSIYELKLSIWTVH